MTSGENQREVVEEIRQIRRDVERAENEQDGVLLGKHFADDVVMTPTEGPQIVGSNAVVEYHRDLYEDWGEMDVEFSIEEITILGGLAVEMGSYEFTMRPPDEDDVQHGGGEYLYTYERQSDGTWKIQQMSWETSYRYRP